MGDGPAVGPPAGMRVGAVIGIRTFSSYFP